MDYLASPALLGGIMFCVALSAWTLGRLQAGVALAHPVRGVRPEPCPAPAAPVADAAATPCQNQARDERQRALGQVISLNELHAEISAYRQQEQIFASLADDAFRVDRARTARRSDCRYMGLTGEPTCAVPSLAIAACGCGQEALCLWEAAPLSGTALQPSLDCVPFTRV
jgi:hypothetical protein